MIKTIGLILIVGLLSFGLYSATKPKFSIVTSQCVGCTECSLVCPPKAISFFKGKAIIDANKCIGCKACVYICSFDAVRQKGVKK